MQSSSSVYVQVLERAANLLGGRQELRAWLRVSMHDMNAWMEGTERPPVYVFLQAVDLISAENEPGGSEVVRRSNEVRRYSSFVASAAHSATESASEHHERSTQLVERSLHLIERSRRLCAALLDNAPGQPARRRPLTVEDFLTTEFASSDGGLIVDTALNALVNGTPAARGNVQLVCTEGLRIVGYLGFQQPFVDFFATVGHDQPSTCGRAAQKLQRVVVTDVETDPIFIGTQASEVMIDAGARACVSTPLVGGSGELVGMLSTHYETPHEPSRDELEAIDLVCRRTSYWLGGAQA